MPPKLTKKLIKAHFDAQAPLGVEASPYQRKKATKWREDSVDDIGMPETDTKK